LFNTNDPQNRTASAQLNLRANPHFYRLSNPLAVYKRAETRVGIGYQIASLAELKLSVLARDHRPLFLRKEVMTHSRIAPDPDDFVSERVFAVQLTAAIFCQNNFHSCVIKGSGQ